VRELVNCTQRAVALTGFDQITVDDLPKTLRDHTPSRAEPVGDGDADQLLPLAEVERRYIQKVLGMLDGNKSQAARALGIDRRTLYRKLERFEKQERADD
jgi:two-component system response regulator HydG